MTAIDMPFTERNLKEERYRQKDNKQKAPMPPLEGHTGKLFYRVST